MQQYYTGTTQIIQLLNVKLSAKCFPKAKRSLANKYGKAYKSTLRVRQGGTQVSKLHDINIA